MTDILTLDTVTQAVELYTGRTPNHPLIHICDLADIKINQNLLQKRLCSNLFVIAMKRNANGQVRYGRNAYDFSSGVISAFGPGQVIEIEREHQPGDLKGWSVMFHPDLLLQHQLREKIKRYGYFSYDAHEALHASEAEQDVLGRLVTEIDRETQQNHDQFSQDILLSSIDLLLKYIERFFNRQFLTRKPIYQDSIEDFLRLVDERLDQAEMNESGLPTVQELANELNMSASYLSDLLRRQTGKSAQELIHLQLINKAKYLLLNSEESVATIAYKLGFEYPQYFSRIFKKKTSMTPSEFRTLN